MPIQPIKFNATGKVTLTISAIVSANSTIIESEKIVVTSPKSLEPLAKGDNKVRLNLNKQENPYVLVGTTIILPNINTYSNKVKYELLGGTPDPSTPSQDQETLPDGTIKYIFYNEVPNYVSDSQNTCVYYNSITLI